ncbi:MAG: transglutaminase protein, partial [Acidimicrobiia bacterium]|nr:transglutaminase protein [Acidimicrobiia bacterium]
MTSAPPTSQPNCRITHRFRYEYAGPVANVHQRLLVVPPLRLGSQQLRSASIKVSLEHTLAWHHDAHGNTVAKVRVPLVEEAVEFVSTVEVQRDDRPEAPLPYQAASDPQWREATALTRATELMSRTARELTAGCRTSEAAAEEIAAFVHRAVEYRHGVTGVDTPAAEALE